MEQDVRTAGKEGLRASEAEKACGAAIDAHERRTVEEADTADPSMVPAKISQEYGEPPSVSCMSLSGI